MSIFDPQSRYALYARTYETVDARGRKVTAVSAPSIPPAATLGEHLLRQGQRLDHLAGHYLGDANGFWRIADHNARLLPDATLAGPGVRIPRAG